MRNHFRYFFVFIAAFSFTFFIVDIAQAVKTEETTDRFTTSLLQTDEQEYSYRISDFKGKLAVFEGKSKIPYKVYNTYVDSLPEKDRNLIKKGIFVNSIAEVKKIIEEYTS